MHVRVAAAFGIGFLVLGFFLLARRATPIPASSGSGPVLLVVLVAQMILGEVQYRNALPWGLVLVHVFLAATIWALAVALTAALWRPPAALAGAATARVPLQSAPVGAAVRE